MNPRTLQVTLFVALGLAALFLFAQTSVPLNQSAQLRRDAYVNTPGDHNAEISQEARAATETGTEIERVDVGDEQDNPVDSEDTLISGREADRVEVGVYIEALCGDSARFIVYDLADAHFPKDLWDIVDMKYYFWGNVRRAADDGTPICQHGAEECELNMLLQCALADLEPVSSPPGEPPIDQKLLECFFDVMLEHRHRGDVMRQTAQKCIVAAGVSYNDAETCMKQGVDAPPVAAAIEKTNALVPPHTWVPWVTVNGEAINPKRLADATHITKEVCTAYKGDTRPIGCSSFPLPQTEDATFFGGSHQ